MNTHYIYALIDVDKTFYIGLTKNLESRRVNHYKKFGSHIELRVVDQYSGKSDTAHALEFFYIKKYRDLGCDLLNINGVPEDKDRKRSFTYSGDPMVRLLAEESARQHGLTFSELVDGLLKSYNESDDSSDLAVVVEGFIKKI